MRRSKAISTGWRPSGPKVPKRLSRPGSGKRDARPEPRRTTTRRTSMQRGADLELPYLTMDEDAFAVDPFPHFERARAQHPWLARWTLGYVVTDYKAMRDLFAHEGRMRIMYDGIVAIMDAKGTPWGNFQERHMLS